MACFRGCWQRVSRRRRDEKGLSIIEMAVAIALVGIVFVAAAQVLTGMMLAGLFSRQNQQAIDLAGEQVETVRGQGYASVGIDPADPTLTPVADPALAIGGSGLEFTPVGGGPAEKVAVQTGASITPSHVKTVTRNKTPYVVRTYVTYPADSVGATPPGDLVYKRVTVRVSWDRRGTTHTRQATTFVTLSRRGLPLPQFTWGDPASYTVTQGAAKLEMKAHLANRGARNTMKLALVPSPARPSWTTPTPTVTWYRDLDGSGTVDTGEPLLPNDGGGNYTTGSLEPDEEIRVVAVVTLVPAEPVGLVGVTLRASSLSQPTAGTAVVSFVNQVTVQAPSVVCPGCTPTTYYLNNEASAPTAPTAAQADMPMTKDVSPTTDAVPPYDFDSPEGLAGRTILPGGGGPAETDLTRTANWRYQSGTHSLTFQGPAAIHLYAATTPSTSSQLLVHIRCQSGGSYTLVGGNNPAGAFTFTQPADSEFHQVVVPATVSTACNPGNNKRIEVKVEVPAGQPAVRIAYDLASFPSFAQLPVVSF